MTDKQNFEKDINVPSKRLDRIDKMEIDLANYEQMERDIEKIIEPYQLNWELGCLSLPTAIQNILERKEQECEELRKQINILLGQLVINDGEDVIVQISQSQFEEYNQLKEELAISIQENEEGREINAELKAENEELKKQIKIIDDETIVVEITEKQFEEYQKLKQALTEIKEIAEENDELLQGYHKEWANNKQILQKISEVEDEHNG